MFKTLAGPDDDTPARSVISGVQEDLFTLADVCEATLGYKGPQPSAVQIGHTLHRLADRLEVALELLNPRPGDEDEPDGEPDEGPPSSEGGFGPH